MTEILNHLESFFSAITTISDHITAKLFSRRNPLTPHGQFCVPYLHAADMANDFGVTILPWSFLNNPIDVDEAQLMMS
jgi:hypothetical protein